MATPAELDNISPDDPRLSPGYYAYYYSQRRLDPRLPPPLVLPWSGYGHYDDDDSNGNLHGADGGFPLEPTEEDLSKVGAFCSHASVSVPGEGTLQRPRNPQTPRTATTRVHPI
jgi:hypothetical protein